jgi:RNA polymerase sigma factor (sigma-70 family)
MQEDAELLQCYVATGSEEAFAEIVRRHVDLVYSVAMRQLGRDEHLAKDVAQRVFVSLAGKAGKLSPRTLISGWLYRAAQFSAIDLLRTEQRRRAREQEAQIMHEVFTVTANETDWGPLRVVLDQAISALAEGDRDAVILRFFEGRSFADIGVRLGLTDDAARMRVDRALNKIRTLLRRRGFTSTTAMLAVTLSNQAGVAAPAGFAAAVTGSVLAGGTTVGAVLTTTSFLGFMTIAKIATGVAALIAVAIALRKPQDRSKVFQAELQTPAATIDRSSGGPVPIANATISPPTDDTVRSSPIAGGSEAQRETRSAPTSVRMTPAAADALQARRAARQMARREARQAFHPEDTANEKTRDAAIRRLTPLFEKLNLTTEQQEELTRLVVDDHQAGIDVAAASARIGEDISDRPEAYWAANKALRAQFLTEVKALLGEEGFEEFLANDLAVRQSAVIEHLQKRLTTTNAILDEHQSEQLLTVLRERETFVVGDEVVDRARAFLSPAQIESLLIEQERQQAGPKKEPVQRTIQRNLVK